MRANANPPSRGSAPRVGSRASAPSAGRCSGVHSGIRAWRRETLQTTKWKARMGRVPVGSRRGARPEGAGSDGAVSFASSCARAGSARACASRGVMRVGRGPALQSWRKKYLAFSFSPSHMANSLLFRTSKSLRETFSSSGTSGILLAIDREKANQRPFDRVSRISSIERFTRGANSSDLVSREDFAEDFDEGVFREIAPVSMCVASAFAPQAWHLREAHDRTGGVVESYLGGRPNRFAPGLSGREQRGGVGVLRRSGEEVSTVGGCFSRRRSGPDVGTHEGARAPRRHRRARGKRFDDVHERGRRRRAVRGGSHVEVRHAPPKDDGIDATRDDVRSKASPPSRRGARRARGGRTNARRAPRSRREMYASRATSRARFRAFASSSLITTPRDRPPAPL